MLNSSVPAGSGQHKAGRVAHSLSAAVLGYSSQHDYYRINHSGGAVGINTQPEYRCKITKIILESQICSKFKRKTEVPLIIKTQCTNEQRGGQGRIGGCSVHVDKGSVYVVWEPEDRRAGVRIASRECLQG